MRYSVLSILERIHSPADLKALPAGEIPELCAELRSFLVQSLSKTGGHLASNLGAVELTVAIDRVYNTERDRLVFDVGHQSYVHKLLTGRREAFSTLRQYGGIAGFPKPDESVHDAFVAGHASTSISVALGMARARTLMGENYDVIALIGDGALTGGLAYEGLSDAGQSGEPMVIVLNDNGMSINKNVGGMATLLSKQRVKPGYLHFKRFYRSTVGKAPGLYRVLHHIKEHVKDLVLPNNMFDDMGFYYIGPVDGHDEPQLEKMLRWARDLRQPVLLHVVTQKGRGISYTEQAPEKYHGVSSFDPVTGALPASKPDFSHVFGQTLSQLADEDPTVVAITAAMLTGTGLETFAKAHPERLYDVGIAEGHAITMASGMAKQGLKPVAAIYSSFLQRAYDMLIHDTSLQRLHLVLGVDRAGIVGNDGDTHNGCFDISYLSSVPYMRILCPASFAELRAMLRKAVTELEGPVAVRYPRGGEGAYQACSLEPVAVLREGSDLTLLTYGIVINDVLQAAQLLAQQGISAEVVKLAQVAPLEAAPVLASLQKTGRLLAVEDVCAANCIGEQVLSAAEQAGLPMKEARLLNLGSGIIPHGAPDVLKTAYGMDAQAIAAAAQALCANDREKGNGA